MSHIDFPFFISFFKCNSLHKKNLFLLTHFQNSPECYEEMTIYLHFSRNILAISAIISVQLTQELYEMLEQADSAIAAPSATAEGDGAAVGPRGWEHSDAIADFFYHGKYMWVGDGVRIEADRVIRALRDATLRSRCSPFLSLSTCTLLLTFFLVQQ